MKILSVTGQRYSFLLLLGIIPALSFFSCFFDAEYPLQNDRPSCSIEHIATTLYYPESSVCTLQISDRNDAELAVTILPCSISINDSMYCDTFTTLPWPGSYTFLKTGYDTKLLHLSLDTNKMGWFRGILRFTDEAGAALEIPYAINKIFRDPFDVYPFSDKNWHCYLSDDSAYCRFDYIDKKLLFTFPMSDDTSTSAHSTGIRSRFTFPSDFYTTIDFKLRDEMDDAFEVYFFISSSPDTGRWDGKKAGFFISGTNGRLRLECRSINLQSYSFESGITAGQLGISRKDSIVSYFFHDGNPAATPKPLTSQMYPDTLPVFIHLKMSVKDLKKDRNCSWNNFVLVEGEIIFPDDDLE